MNNKSSCNPAAPAPAIDLRRIGLLLCVVVCVMAVPRPAQAGGEAPAWMHTAASAPLPPPDEKTDAVLLYSEQTVNVQSVDKIKTRIRMAYKILRPGGRHYGTVIVPFSPLLKITGLHGWCIPAQGKDYEVKEKEAVETSLLEIQGGELYSDVKDKVLRIPASEPGNIVGFEYEIEERPLFLQDIWAVQEESPTRESHYVLQLPPGWEYQSAWLNYPEAKPTESGSGRWEWTINDVKGIRREVGMPPVSGVRGQMIVYLFPPGGAGSHSFATWNEMGKWYSGLTSGRRQVSPEITKQVSAITAQATTPLEKMKALAQFMQHDIRYVAIYLGIGGVQPH